MTEGTTDDWEEFVRSVAALDESAATRLDDSNMADASAREKFEADRDKLTEFLRNEDWEGIANELYDGVNPAAGDVGETGAEDGAGSRPVQADAGEKPVE